MSEIDVQVRFGVAIITLSASTRRNALTVAMCQMLTAACDRIDSNPDIGAAVIRGAGGYFCAGADRNLISSAGRDPAATGTFAALTTIYRSFTRVAELSVPSVAAVRGGAVGAGVNLLLSTSLRVIAAEATINPGFTGLGLHPGGGHLALLRRAATYDATVAIGLLGESISGRQAKELGLAWEAPADPDVETRAEQLVQLIARDPELSRMVTESLKHEVGPPPMALSAAMQFERSAQMRSQRRIGEAAGEA
jgi:enoyl-CoA hydratase